MANTGNTQQIINYGATANDGTGDPLRDAFIKVEENFDSIWLTGPVGSNITIGNNTIQSNNTNGNITIKPNGTGVIQANASVIPNSDNTRDLGSAGRTWRRAYINNMTVGDFNTTGNLLVAGNLTVQGDTIQIGNITTDTLTVQLANSAASANAANGAGITVGANDDLATILYDAAANAWAVNVGLNVAGNLTAALTLGSSLGTGDTPWANAYIYNIIADTIDINEVSSGNLATGNIIAENIDLSGSETGNIIAGNVLVLNNISALEVVRGKRGSFPGDSDRGENAIYAGYPLFTVLGSDVVAQFSGNVNAYTQFNFQNGNSGTLASGDYVITADNGTDTTYFFNMGLGSSNHDDPEFFGDTSTSNDAYIYVVGADATGPGDTGPGNLLIGSTNGSIKMFVGNTAQANVIQTLTTSGVVVKGNVIPAANAVYSLGNATNYWSNLWVANNTIYIGGVPLGVSGNVLTVDGQPILSNNSNTAIITTGNITADYFIGDGSLLSNLPIPNPYTLIRGTTQVNIPVANGVVDVFVNGGQASYQFNEYNQLTFTDGSAVGNISGSFGLAAIPNTNIRLETATSDGMTTTTYGWTLDTTGNLITPTGLVIGTSGAGGSQIQQYDAPLIVVGEGANSAVIMGWAANQNVPDSIAAVGFNTPYPDGASNVQIVVGNNATVVNYWNFDGTGNLTLPNNGSIIVDGDGVIGPVSDDMVISWDNEELILRSVAGSIELQADNDVRMQSGYNGGLGDYQYKWSFSNNNELVNITGDSAIVTEAGNLAISGGRDGLSSGNVTVRAVDVGVAVQNWTFENSGQITLPGGTAYLSSSADTITMYSDTAELNGMLFYNGGVDIYASDQLAIFANNAGATRETRFLSDGTISVQGMIYPVTGYTAVDLGNSTNNFRDGWFSGNVKASGLLIDTVTGITANAGNVNINQITGLGGWLNAVGANLSGNVNADSLNIVDINVTGNIISNLYADGEVEILGNVNIENQLTVDSLLVDTVGGITANAGNIDINQITGLGGYLNAVGVSLSGNIAGNVAGYAIGYRDIPQVLFTGNATIATTDAGKHFYSTQSTDYILTIANNASQGFQVGAVITVVNQGTGNITVAQGSGVTLYMAGSSTTGNRAVGAYGLASVMKVATDTWVISGTGVY